MTGGDRKAKALGMDPQLWPAVERCAPADLRRLNSEVECLLREALKARGVKLDPPQPIKRGRPKKGA